jgi:hypothetical protein
MELLPCPWPSCGYDRPIVVCNSMNWCYYVKCVECGARGPEAIYKDDAIKFWNYRGGDVIKGEVPGAGE